METPDGKGSVAFLSALTDRERGTVVHLLPVRGPFSPPLQMCLVIIPVLLAGEITLLANSICAFLQPALEPLPTLTRAKNDMAPSAEQQDAILKRSCQHI